MTTAVEGPAVADWEEHARCREIGSELFFRPDGDENSPTAHRYTDARRICTSCPVRLLCLESAMAREGGIGHQYRGGMWGGLSPTERQALAIRRSRPGAVAA